MTNELYKIVELLSNGLAMPMILLSLAVVILWFEPAKRNLKQFKGSPEQWFIIGVFFGFMGTFFDNIYWTIAWSLHYLEAEAAATWMKYGVFSNIPFRQIIGIFAAYCHVKSALEYRKENQYKPIVRYVLLFSIILGFIYSLFLFLL